MDVNLKNKINIGFDLFQMEQLNHIITEVDSHPDRDNFIMDDTAHKEIVELINTIKRCYNEALDDIGFTVYDHLDDKLDYPDKCNTVVDLINDKYQRINE